MAPTFLLVTNDGDTLDLRIYNDLRRLLGEIEPPEVQDGAYELFDGLGRKAELAADERRWQVTIADWLPGWEEQMRRALVQGTGDEELGARIADLDPGPILDELENRVGIIPPPADWSLGLRRWLVRIRDLFRGDAG